VHLGISFRAIESRQETSRRSIEVRLREGVGGNSNDSPTNLPRRERSTERFRADRIRPRRVSFLILQRSTFLRKFVSFSSASLYLHGDFYYANYLCLSIYLMSIPLRSISSESAFSPLHRYRTRLSLARITDRAIWIRT
jgi:hypothetical protein